MKFYRIASYSAVLVGLVSVASPALALNLGAMSDVRVESSTQKGEVTHFRLGTLDLFTSQKISTNTDAFIETAFEDGGDGFGLDVERLWVRREINPLFKIAAGRFHAPLGYWNRHFHHGVLIQDTPDRPQFLEFEDGDGAILPMHAIGLMATGDAVTGAGTFGYEFNIANGSFLDTDLNGGLGNEIGIGDVLDVSDRKNFFLRGTYKPFTLPIEVGLFGASINYLERHGGTSPSALLGAQDGDLLVKQSVAGLDVHYNQGRLDVLSELFYLHDDSRVSGGKSGHATAFYAQAGWQLMQKLKVVYRFEMLDAGQSKDTYFMILNTPNYVHNIVGLRYDLDDSNALMFQLKNVNAENLPKSTVSNHYNVFTLDWAFMFL
jgi:hypothetical protein